METLCLTIGGTVIGVILGLLFCAFILPTIAFIMFINVWAYNKIRDIINI